jgi:hypothetical protein
MLAAMIFYSVVGIAYTVYELGVISEHLCYIAEE